MFQTHSFQSLNFDLKAKDPIYSALLFTKKSFLLDSLQYFFLFLQKTKILSLCIPVISFILRVIVSRTKYCTLIYPQTPSPPHRVNSIEFEVVTIPQLI